MNIGVIGLGRMGSAIAHRLAHAGHQVYGFDTNKKIEVEAQIERVDAISLVGKKARVIWLMLPAGPLIDQVLEEFLSTLHAGDIVIDGGNSHFSDSIKRAERLSHRDIHFLDCGTSGGIYGRDNGFCLMVGGNKEAFDRLQPIWQAVAAPDGYAHVGLSGAGHYVKMVHNGIEYALMQAYAEGLHLLHASEFGGQPFDLAQISALWNHGSVIRSFLLQLITPIFAHDQELASVGGQVAQSGMGQWTVEQAAKHKVPVASIELALKTREWSRETGGNYATKIMALMRQQFGGHAITKLED